MNFKKMLIIASLSLGVLGNSAAAQDYPQEPITLVCWSSAGSGHDLMARYIAKLGEKYIGQPIVVVNKKGGKGKVAMSYVLNQKPDGYVIMTNTRSMTERLKKDEGAISASSFKYISRVVKDPFVFVVKKDSPFNSLDDLIKYAKENPNKVSMGGYSTKSVDEKLVAELEKAAGVNFNYVPYKGGKEPVVAVLGGHIDVAVANPSEMLANYESGDLRVLAVASEERFSPFDEVATLKESGYPVVEEHWRGMMASKDVPDEIIAKLNDMVEKVVAEDEFKAFLESANMYNGYMPGDQFETLVFEQISE